MVPASLQQKSSSYTRSYSQPEEYHFCMDSVLLAEFVAGEMPKKLPENFRLLDLCAGCGVVGFEIAHRRPELPHLDLNEIQDSFSAHLFANREQLSKNTESKIYIMDHQLLKRQRLELEEPAYDLIVANPPYFFVEEGTPPITSLKNRCRFFMDSTFEALLDSVIENLKPGGTAYILVKAGDKHGRNQLREIALHLQGRARCEVAATIRGTNVLKLYFNA